MSFKAIAVSLPLLWRYTAALPAGSGFTNGSFPFSISDIHARSTYNLIDRYDSSNWMSKFDVQAISDPTRMILLHVTVGSSTNKLWIDGYVDYVDAQDAQNLGLYKIEGDKVYMGVDTSSTLDPNGQGRKSVRVQSKATYNQVLVVTDIAHVPGSACGSWPA